MTEIRVGHHTSLGSSTGTGTTETIAHGLPAIPNIVLIYVPTTGEITGAASDSTNIYPNVVNGTAYKWWAIL